MKPIIGLNLDVKPGAIDQVSLNATYLKAIQSAGGIPLLIPPMPDHDMHALLSNISGLVLVGGQDYDPKLYGADPHEKTTKAHPWRQDFDARLARQALFETNIPVLGICAGHQLINIVLGGTLFQDIGTELLSFAPVEHGNPDIQSDFSRHEIEIESSSHLRAIYGQKRLDVPSSHHQAIDSLGTGLTVSARAADGVIESIELTERSFTVGVQWHPERDYAGNAALFDTFVTTAASLF